MSPRSAISNTPTSSVDPYRFFVARSRRSPPVRSPSTDSTTSTRCSRVFGPASVPSLVTCPTSTTGTPSDFASSMSRSAASRTWPTLPAGPSSSSDTTVCTESTTRSPGCARARELHDPVHARSRRRPRSAPPRRPWSARGVRPAAGPGPRTPRRSRTGRRTSARDAGRDLEQERGLADARLAAEEDDRSRRRARRRGPGRARRSPPAGAAPRRPHRRGRARPARPHRPTAVGRLRGSSRTTVSTRVFHSPHERHWPSQRGTAALQDWQTNRLWTRATRATRARDQASTGVFASVGRDAQAVAVGIEIDRDRVALAVPAQQQVLGERVLDQVLDRRGAAAARRTPGRSRA